jgi:PEP-CTERM/exosortase A-associated glycosyltransferase
MGVARQFRPDLLHAHSPALNGLAGLIAARHLGLPLVYEVRAFWEDAAVDNGTGQPGSARYRLSKALETWVAKRADAVIPISQGIADDLRARGVAADRLTIVPNGVAAAHFAKPVQRNKRLADRFGLNGRDVLGFVGSLYPYEGIEDVIAGLPEIVGARPQTTLLIVGGGPAETRLRAQAAQSPVARHIHFTGRCPPEEAVAFYDVIDIALYPRRKSRLTDLVTPLKPLEAMARGCVVLASDVGGHQELIEDGRTGVLFKAGDMQAMASAIVSLLGDSRRQSALRTAAAKYVGTTRRWSHLVARYDPVYHRLCSHAGK